MSESITVDIKSLEVLIKKYKLKIPDYQRPYTWKKSTADTLFNDMYSAMKKNKDYSLGSLILHKEEDENKEEKVHNYCQYLCNSYL